ncbi:MAG TPA: hypothetical protein VGG74_24570 [Kofleriaceae bacterium]|jgi:hypothetical protein
MKARKSLSPATRRELQLVLLEKLLRLRRLDRRAFNRIARRIAGGAA